MSSEVPSSQELTPEQIENFSEAVQNVLALNPKYQEQAMLQLAKAEAGEASTITEEFISRSTGIHITIEQSKIFPPGRQSQTEMSVWVTPVGEKLPSGETVTHTTAIFLRRYEDQTTSVDSAEESEVYDANGNITVPEDEGDDDIKALMNGLLDENTDLEALERLRQNARERSEAESVGVDLQGRYETVMKALQLPDIEPVPEARGLND